MRKDLVAAGLAAAWSVIAVTATAEPLRLFTEEAPPHNRIDPATKKVGGMSTELIEMAMQRAGLAYTIELTNWNRAYQTALTQAQACVYSTTRTEEREPLFKWAVPLFDSDWTLFAMADRNIRLSSLDEARGYLIGSYKADAVGEFLKAQGFRMDMASDEITSVRKLAAGRIDLWAAGGTGGLWQARSVGAGQIKPVLVFKDVALGLACNRTVPDPAMAAITAQLKALHEDGSADRIQDRYR